MIGIGEQVYSILLLSVFFLEVINRYNICSHIDKYVIYALYSVGGVGVVFFLLSFVVV